MTVPGYGLPEGTIPRLTWLSSFILSLTFVLGMLLYFHDRSWWPPDEGVYAYVAEQVLNGAVLHRDVQDIHAGYVHFVHALALQLFGKDVLSLRYFLAALTIAQAGIAFLLLAPQGRIIAIAAAIAMGCLSFLLFINPSANWYALSFAMGIAATLTWSGPGSSRRDVAVGALVMACFLFRQLSGLFVAMAALTWLLCERDGGKLQKPVLARSLIAIMGSGISAYIILKGSYFAAAIFGVWPLCALAVAWRKVGIGNSATLLLLGRLCLGGLIAATPLVAYHIAHGSIVPWVNDAFLAASRMNGLEFMDKHRYSDLLKLSIGAILGGNSLESAANGLFWLLALIFPVLLGTRFVRLASVQGEESYWRPLPLMAMFYGLVAIHFQIPIYLIFTVALTLVGFLSLAGKERSDIAVISVIVASMTSVALFYQAAQPLSRGIVGTATGTRIGLVSEGLPHASITMEPEERSDYLELLSLIEENTAPTDTILALPMNPELYFLSGRKPPYRYFSTAFGINSVEDLTAAIDVLETSPPRLVIHRRLDKYNTAASEALVAHVEEHATHVATVSGYDVYLWTEPAPVLPAAQDLKNP